MSETLEVAVPAAEPKAAAANDKPRKPAKKSKAKVKPAAAPAKNGPSKPQLRILRALVKAGRPMAKDRLSKASGVHVNWVAEYVGGTANPVSDEVRGRKKLVPAGLARVVEVDHDGVKERLIEATAAGRKALERADKAAS